MKNFLLLLFLVVSVPATGAVIHVPGDKTNIQEAIDYAADGDSILVTSGTYSGEGNRDIDFSGKAITVSASSGTVVIDCEGLGRGFVFQSGEGQSSVLENIEIINGSASFGGGIFILNSSPVLSKVTISDCNVGSFGGGAYLSNSSSFIEDMHITRCSSVSGGGIYCTECLDMGLVFKNCQITDCSGSTNGGGLYIENSRLKLQGLSILRNNVDSYGGGLFLSNQADIESDACRIVSNYAWGGAGIYCFESNPLISNSFIYDNTAGFVAGGMQFIDSSAKVINCTLKSNESQTENGGGIRCDTSNPLIKNTILWDDTPDEIFLYESSPTVEFCDVLGGWTGLNNINSDPNFEVDWDCNLLAGSPCIDTGDTTSNNKDIYNTFRPQGAGFDIGAFEYLPSNSLSNAVASDAVVGMDGIDSDDYVLFTFVQPTLKPEINAENVDSVLELNNGHSWLDWAGRIGAADWNTDGTQLYLNLSTHPLGVPSVIPGDSVTVHISMVRCEQVIITGSFDPAQDIQIQSENDPQENLLIDCSPNPFNPTTVIRFTLSKPCSVNLTIYDIMGRRIKILKDETMNAGLHQVIWNGETDNGRKATSGIYYCRMTTEEKDVSGIRMVLLK